MRVGLLLGLGECGDQAGRGGGEGSGPGRGGRRGQWGGRFGRAARAGSALYSRVEASVVEWGAVQAGAACFVLVLLVRVWSPATQEGRTQSTPTPAPLPPHIVLGLALTGLQFRLAHSVACPGTSAGAPRPRWCAPTADALSCCTSGLPRCTGTHEPLAPSSSRVRSLDIPRTALRALYLACGPARN